MLFWRALWCIKVFLLFLFRRLIIDLPHYTIAWHAVTCFTAVSYILCLITEFTSCSSVHAGLSPSKSSVRRCAVID